MTTVVSDPPAGERPHSDGGAGQGLPTREVRRYDFEEIEHEPAAFPLDFYRVGLSTGFHSDSESPGLHHQVGRPGHPSFGSMGYSRDQSHSGAWSFRFELGGGSMTASLDPRAMQVIPGGDYLITAWVRTSGLAHARARLSAMFVDQRRAAMPLSRVEGDLIRPDGVWQCVSVRVRGDFVEASGLVAELQVLQPAQYVTGADSTTGPLLEDVSGSAWFDDVSIWHVPRLELRTTAAGAHGNIIMAPARPGLEVAVTDFAKESLPAILTVTDLAGTVVHTESLLPTPGRSRRRVDLANLPFGWYRAEVTFRHDGVDLGGDVVAFAHLPGGPSTLAFGVNLEREDLLTAPASAALAASLRCSPVVLPAWDATHQRESPRAVYEPMRAAADLLQENGAEVTFSLPLVPIELEAELGVYSIKPFDLFLSDPAATEASMDSMLFALGQRVSRWQVGPVSGGDASWNSNATQGASGAARTLAQLVPGPRVVLPWSIEVPPLPDAPCAYHVLIPHHLPPASIGAAIAPWLEIEGTWFTIEPLPAGEYGDVDRTHDLASRMLHAWRAGATQLLLGNPWGHDGAHDAMPDPLFATWLQLGRILRSHTFGGDVPAGRGLVCWLLEGPAGATIAAWNESAAPRDAFIESPSMVSECSIRDIFGNHVESARTEDNLIALGPQPLFIGGVNPAVARFRQGFRIEPATAASTRLEHAHEVVVTNPWPITISGNLRLVEPTAWSFTPSRFEFTIPAGGTARLPFLLTLGSQELAGPKRIEAEVRLHTGQAAEFRVSARFEVGDEDLSLDPVWRIVRSDDGSGDVVIETYVTNGGDAAVQLEAFVRAPGYSRLSRFLARLEPGETTVRAFVLENGESLLSGQRILVGVVEIDGPARINREIRIP